jgi:cell division protein FtsQ
VLAVLVTAVLGIFLLGNTVFVVRSLRIEGNRFYTTEQVAALSGIRDGQNVFTIRQDEVAKRVSGASNLALDSLSVVYPSTVILRVREREPRAIIHWLGSQLLLDETGSLLHSSAVLDEWPQVPVVTGVMDENNPTVMDGQLISPRHPDQLRALRVILEELRLQGYTPRVAELNLADLDNLYLVTQEGMIVEFGNMQNMEVKIGIVRGVLTALAAQGVVTGTVDVSSGLYGDYRKEKVYTKEFVPDPTVAPRATPAP